VRDSAALQQTMVTSGSLAEDPTKRPCVAILLGSPFTEQNVERLGLHQLEPHLDIHVIDCARLIGRNPDAISVQRVHWPYYKTISTAEELRRALRSCGASWAIDNIGFDIDTAWVGEIVKTLGVGIVSVKSGRLPLPSLKDRLRAFIISTGEAVALSLADAALPTKPQAGRRPLARAVSLWHKVANRVTYEWKRRNYVPTPDLVLLAGSDALDAHDVKRAAAKIWIGSEDYYKFQTVAAQIATGELAQRQQPFALFVDVCLPHATDWKFLGITPPITAEEYYPLLRRLFDRVEWLLGMPIVVAGHPNTRWVPDYAALVGGRELVLGSTAALVMQAELVLTHASTATSFIALAARPSVFVSSHSIDRTYYGSRVRAMAESLSSPLVMLEGANELERDSLPRAANATACRRYVARYLRSDEAKEQGPWQGLIEFITRHPTGPINY
jgi:hypothetical protein